MTQRQIARLACKMLAIYAVIQAIETMGGDQGLRFRAVWLAVRFPMRSDIWALGFAFLTPMLHIGLALWLWTRASVISVWMCGPSEKDDRQGTDVLTGAVDVDVWQSLLISSMGVWILITVVPQAVSYVADSGITWMIERQPKPEKVDAVVSRTSAWACQIGIGLWLIFGNARIVRMLRRFRLKPY